MKTTDKIVLQVANDLDTRSVVGIEKYGTTLERNDLSLKDWLKHAYEETLDKALYLKRAIIEIEQNEMLSTPEEQCKAVLNTLEEPYRTQALENFDSEYFANRLHSFDGTKSRALLTSFRWGKSNIPIAEYYNNLTLKGE